MSVKNPKYSGQPIILDECPRCLGNGISSSMILLKGISKKTQKPFEFAKCEDCGYIQNTHNGTLLPVYQCPQCNDTLQKRVKVNGQHFWFCLECEIWLVADINFLMVEPPLCLHHKTPMKHTSSKDNPEAFYWYCKENHCSIRIESDRYGKIAYETEDDQDSIL